MIGTSPRRPALQESDEQSIKHLLPAHWLDEIALAQRHRHAEQGEGIAVAVGEHQVAAGDRLRDGVKGLRALDLVLGGRKIHPLITALGDDENI